MELRIDESKLGCDDHIRTIRNGSTIYHIKLVIFSFFGYVSGWMFSVCGPWVSIGSFTLVAMLCVLLAWNTQRNISHYEKLWKGITK